MEAPCHACCRPRGRSLSGPHPPCRWPALPRTPSSTATPGCATLRHAAPPTEGVQGRSGQAVSKLCGRTSATACTATARHCAPSLCLPPRGARRLPAPLASMMAFVAFASARRRGAQYLEGGSVTHRVRPRKTTRAGPESGVRFLQRFKLGLAMAERI